MDAAAADAEEAAAAAHHEAAQRQAAAAGAAADADDDAQDMDAAEDGEEADDMEADAAEEGRPSGTTKECMECGEEKVGCLHPLYAAREQLMWADCRHPFCHPLPSDSCMQLHGGHCV